MTDLYLFKEPHLALRINLIVSSNILGAWLLLEFLFWLFLLHLLYVVYGNDFKILFSMRK